MISGKKLASIQKINKIIPIHNAEKIELAYLLGWQIVVEKGIYKENDIVIFCELDSFLPIRPEFEFLRKSSYKKLEDGTEGFRLKSVRLRGQLSQGLCLPLSVLETNTHKIGKYYQIDNHSNIVYAYCDVKDEDGVTDIPLEEGTDVSSILGVTHYEKPIPANLAGQIEGNFPSFLRKTDEIRIQSDPDMLERLQGKPYYITTKIDGTSATYFYKDGKFGVCSRNLQLKENPDNTYWKIAEKYKLAKILESAYKLSGEELCIQGEIYGEGVQKNPLNIKGQDFAVFNLYNIKKGEYVSLEQLINFCDVYGLKTVPIEEQGNYFAFTQEHLLERARGKYSGTDNNKEGIVIRSIDKSISFKVLNNDFLLKDEE